MLALSNLSQPLEIARQKLGFHSTHFHLTELQKTIKDRLEILRSFFSNKY